MSRKCPIIILGLAAVSVVLSQIGLAGCKPNRLVDAQKITHDTIHISDDYDLDADFYNLYHPDSVRVTAPEGFTYYTDYEVRKYGRLNTQLTYALGIMLPNASYPHSSQIAKWVIKRVGDNKAFMDGLDIKSADSNYQGNLFNGREVFDFMSNRFFRDINNEETLDDIAYHDGITMTVAYSSPRFITYIENTDCYWGGAHGMYTQKYYTLDISSGKELQNRDIFRSECIDSIKSELYKAASVDSAYLEAHNHEPGEDISYVFQDENGNFELPQAALLESGVVFSFQPYEISGFAQGCFHFTIPYSNIMPYLTPLVKSLIGK